MYCPHDLLRIDPKGLSAAAPTPDWVTESLRQYPWVVVRRQAYFCPQQVAVGVRGERRSQRFAMQLEDAAVLECRSPVSLVERIHDNLRHSPLPCLAALPSIATLLQGLCWGVGGSVAYHLATGAPCIHFNSDLDLLLYPFRTMSRSRAAQLLVQIRGMFEGADVLLETSHGAYSLAEYVQPLSRLLCRTPQGPVVREHPDDVVAQTAALAAHSLYTVSA